MLYENGSWKRHRTRANMQGKARQANSRKRWITSTNSNDYKKRIKRRDESERISDQTRKHNRSACQR